MGADLRLGRHGAVVAVLVIGCSTATPTIVPTGSGLAPGSPGPVASGALRTPGSPGTSPIDEVSGPSSADLIIAARERGDLSDQDAAVYRVLAAFGDERLPAEFQSENEGWEDHLATRDASGMWDQLSAEQREQIAPYFIPPIYAGSWADPAPETGARSALIAGLGAFGAPLTAAVDPKDCPSEQLRGQFYVNVPAAGGKVRIWWRNGIETSAKAGTVASMLATEIDTNIWPKLTALMGREPLSDDAVGCFNGEDGALDIYLSDRFLGRGTQALTMAYPGKCTNTPAFIIFDSRLIDPATFLAWKFAHEIFHAIQFSYAYAGPCEAYGAMDEATAVWAAEFIYPADQFEWSGGGIAWASWFWHNWDGFYLHGSSAANGGYGSWPFFSSITNRHGVDRIPMLYEAAETVESELDAMEIMTPGGLDGYWPQFVRDLWDDHEEHNVWADWDPGIWSTVDWQGGADGGLVEVPRPGGGGILTNDLEHHWRIAPWSQSPCVQHPDDNPNWGFIEAQTIGSWWCPVERDTDPPATVSYPRLTSVHGLGREEHEYWFADEDWPRYIKIIRPGLGSDDEHLSVQGYYQLGDGSWTGPLDWKGEDEIEFCRDDADKDVRRIAILYGNSEIDGRMSGNYEVEVRDTCPPPSYEGTIAERSEWDVEGSHGYWQASGSARFEYDAIQSWAGGQVFVLVSASITFEGEIYSRHQEDLDCTQTFPAQTIEYSDPLGPNHDYGEGGQIILDTLGLEGVGPPNNYFGNVTLLEELAGTGTCNRAGTVNSNPIGGEWIIPALAIRFHAPQETSVFVLTDDGLMQGTDAFESQVTLGGNLGQIQTSWSLAPTDK